MSNEKTTSGVRHEVPAAPGGGGDSRPAAVQKPVKNVSLALDDDDGGGDPYNHTGSYAVPDFALED